MKTELEDLATAVAALLDAELVILPYDQALAQAAGALARQAMAAARRAIGKALDEPADAWGRRAQLQAAIDLDGVDSPLAASAALRFAEAASLASAA